MLRTSLRAVYSQLAQSIGRTSRSARGFWLSARRRRAASASNVIGVNGVDDTGAHPVGPADLLLVCSPGGHLLQLHALAPVWRDHSRVWVTLAKSDSRSLLEGENVVFAHGPAVRSVRNLLRNLLLAWRVVRAVRPEVVLTTGAAVAVPFAWVGRLHGARVVYVESLARTVKPSLSCRLTAPVANRVYVQWPELLAELPKARYVGSVFGR
jgi:beta-1,4-N-acetylglucosaminyltransferase